MPGTYEEQADMIWQEEGRSVSRASAAVSDARSSSSASMRIVSSRSSLHPVQDCWQSSVQHAEQSHAPLDPTRHRNKWSCGLRHIRAKVARHDRSERGCMVKLPAFRFYSKGTLHGGFCTPRPALVYMAAIVHSLRTRVGHK